MPLLGGFPADRGVLFARGHAGGAGKGATIACSRMAFVQACGTPGKQPFAQCARRIFALRKPPLLQDGEDVLDKSRKDPGVV